MSNWRRVIERNAAAVAASTKCSGGWHIIFESQLLLESCFEPHGVGCRPQMSASGIRDQGSTVKGQTMVGC